MRVTGGTHNRIYRKSNSKDVAIKGKNFFQVIFINISSLEGSYWEHKLQNRKKEKYQIIHSNDCQFGLLLWSVQVLRIFGQQ